MQPYWSLTAYQKNPTLLQTQAPHPCDSVVNAPTPADVESNISPECLLHLNTMFIKKTWKDYAMPSHHHDKTDANAPIAKMAMPADAQAQMAKMAKAMGAKAMPVEAQMATTTDETAAAKEAGADETATTKEAEANADETAVVAQVAAEDAAAEQAEANADETTAAGEFANEASYDQFMSGQNAQAMQNFFATQMGENGMTGMAGMAGNMAADVAGSAPTNNASPLPEKCSKDVEGDCKTCVHGKDAWCTTNDWDNVCEDFCTRECTDECKD